MSRTSGQILRQIKLIAEMCKGSFPNAQSFAWQLAFYEDGNGQPFSCSSCTISRDIQMLQAIYHAPIEYDESRRGFYLKDLSWKFRCPLDESTITMALLTIRLAKDMAPEPLHMNLKKNTSQPLADGTADFFDQAMIVSLPCTSSCKSSVTPSFFQASYQKRKSLHGMKLTYQSPVGERRKYMFESRVITFHNGNWHEKEFIIDDEK